jgi:hypothetical protein
MTVTLLQRFNKPFNSDKVYFSMEIQVKLYRRVMFTFHKLLSEDGYVCLISEPCNVMTMHTTLIYIWPALTTSAKKSLFATVDLISRPY